MRLTNRYRTEIINAAMRKAGFYSSLIEGKKVLSEQRKRLVEQQNNAIELIMQHYIGKYHKSVKYLPEKHIAMETSLVSVVVGHSEVINLQYFNGKNYALANIPGLCRSEGAIPLTKNSDAGKAVLAWKKSNDNFVKTKNEFESAVKTLVYSSTTTAALLKKWPEAKEFLTTEHAKPSQELVDPAKLKFVNKLIAQGYGSQQVA